jgi:hypothetical protein
MISLIGKRFDGAKAGKRCACSKSTATASGTASRARLHRHDAVAVVAGSIRPRYLASSMSAPAKRSFRDLISAMFRALGRADIEYVDMPPASTISTNISPKLRSKPAQGRLQRRLHPAEEVTRYVVPEPARPISVTAGPGSSPAIARCLKREVSSLFEQAIVTIGTVDDFVYGEVTAHRLEAPAPILAVTRNDLPSAAGGVAQRAGLGALRFHQGSSARMKQAVR